MKNTCIAFNNKPSLREQRPHLYEEITRYYGLPNEESPLVDELVRIELNYRRGLITEELCDELQKKVIEGVK